jgi:EAL domain-containing protein (putative c-di-GMP-specific phosphodiesterase class I)
MSIVLSHGGQGSAAGALVLPDRRAVHPVMYLQPVVDLATGQTVAAEALARFPEAPELPVGSVFARAHAVGGGVSLEASCVRAALDLLPDVPPGVELAVNISPDALEHPLMQEALRGNLAGVIVEITEQPAADLGRLSEAVTRLRRRGARIAIDDVTTGHAGLTRLAELRPDIIKIDRGAVRAVGTGAEHVAVIEALVSLGRRLDCLVLAEGVESLDDLAVLAELDVDLVQGWAIATPAPELGPVADAVRAACLDARRELLHLTPTLPRSAREIDIHHVTAELARTAHRFELDRAIVAASYTLGMTMIGVSALDPDGTLHEVIATGAEIDPTPYRLVDYPATAAALRDGVMLEVYIDQEDADPYERALLDRLGMASVLLVPLTVEGRPSGALELFRDTPKRWSAREIKDARILAQHLAHALDRLPGA